MSLGLGGIDDALHDSRAVRVLGSVHVVQQDAYRTGTGGGNARIRQRSTGLHNRAFTGGSNLDRDGLVVVAGKNLNRSAVVGLGKIHTFLSFHNSDFIPYRSD